MSARAPAVQPPANLDDEAVPDDSKPALADRMSLRAYTTYHIAFFKLALALAHPFSSSPPFFPLPTEAPGPVFLSPPVPVPMPIVPMPQGVAARKR